MDVLMRGEARNGGEAGARDASDAEPALLALYRSFFLEPGENEPYQAVSRHSPRTNNTLPIFPSRFRIARETAEVVHPCANVARSLDFNSWSAISTKSLFKTSLL